MERYEDIYTDISLGKDKIAKRLPRYCSLVIGQYVKAMEGYKRRDWDRLKIIILEEFRDTDIFQ